MNIILCGMPMSGKSFFGKKLAARLKSVFIDTDIEIEKVAGKPCREIALEEGEKAFRGLETEVIKRLATARNTVIAVGGGAFSQPENRSLLRELGILIYLQTDSYQLLKRLMEKKEVPSYIDPKKPLDSFLELIQKRAPIFESLSDKIVNTTGLSEEEILWQVISLVNYLELQPGESLTEKRLALSSMDVRQV